jgi:hypothetical protein
MLMKKLSTFSLLLLALTACDMASDGKRVNPLTPEEQRWANRGKLTGESGWNLLGGSDGDSAAEGTRLGVNSFIWRATLDTLAFMPLTSADPFGGVILTDWYEDPKTPGERFKVNAMILDSTLRADSVKIRLFKQQRAADGWQDMEVNPKLSRKLEDTILTRAREMRIAYYARKAG